MQANTCPFLAVNSPCTSGCPSDNFCNRGPTRVPTAPSITTNVSQTIDESQEAAPIIFWAIKPVIFHQYSPTFSPSVLQIGDKWPALPACADTAHVAPTLTETSAPNPAASGPLGAAK